MNEFLCLYLWSDYFFLVKGENYPLVVQGLKDSDNKSRESFFFNLKNFWVRRKALVRSGSAAVRSEYEQITRI